MNNYMDYLSSYNDFLIAEMTMQGHMMDCIEEAVALAEGTTYVHEGVITNGLKNAWNKFVQFINKIFAKFKETFNRIDPKGYLEKYAGIITKQPLKFNDLTMVNYDLAAISKLHAEQFDPAKIDTYAAGNGAYLKSIYNDYNGSNETEDINTFIKNKLCNGSADEVEINVQSLNMTDLYTFCHDFKDKTENELTKDKDAITKSANVFENLLKQLDDAEKKQAADAAKAKELEKKADGKPAEEPKSTERAPKPANTDDTDPALDTDKIQTKTYGSPEESAHIALDRSFKSLSELSIGTKGVNDANGGAPAVDANTKFSKNASGLSGQETNKDAVIKTVGGFTKEQITAAVSSYRTVNTAICSIKLSLCQAAYTDYMQIIKTHVRSYVGETQQTPRTAQNGTDYSQGQPAKPAADQNAQNAAGAANAAIGGQK